MMMPEDGAALRYAHAPGWPVGRFLAVDDVQAPWFGQLRGAAAFPA